ncbi:hypothetical protein ACWF2L_04950 [Streptomyces anulatus]
MVGHAGPAQDGQVPFLGLVRKASVRSAVPRSATPLGPPCALRTCSSGVGSASMAIVSPARRRRR